MTDETAAPPLPRRIMLRVESHDQSGAFVADTFPYVIGRSMRAQLRLTDPSVSKLHARLDAVPNGGLVLQDLGSAAGIVHRGKRVAELPLVANETVLLGDVEVEIILDEQLPKTQPPLRIEALAEGSAGKTTALTVASLAGGFLALCLPAAADQYAAFWPPERPQDIATEAFTLWLIVLGAAFAVSLFCKLNARRFHFDRIFRLMVGTVLASELMENLMGTIVFNFHNVRPAVYLWHLGYAALAFVFVYRLLRYAFARWAPRLRAAVAGGCAVLAIVVVQVMDLTARGAGERTDLTELGLPLSDPTTIAARTNDLSHHLAAAAKAAEDERGRVEEKLDERREEDAPEDDER